MMAPRRCVQTLTVSSAAGQYRAREGVHRRHSWAHGSWASVWGMNARSVHTVDGEYAAEGQAVAVAGGPVAGVDEGVVFAPVGQLVPSPKQGVLYPAFYILDSVQEGVRGLTVAGARRAMPASAHIGFTCIGCHLESVTGAVGVYILSRL